MVFFDDLVDLLTGLCGNADTGLKLALELVERHHGETLPPTNHGTLNTAVIAYLLGKGVPISDIADYLGVSDRAVYYAKRRLSL